MLKKIINRLLRKRHFWRDVSFDELSEIYANRLLATIALSLVGIFVPVYLYTLHYSLTAIFGFFTVFFAARLFFDILSAFLVGEFGAKRIIVLSQIMQVCGLLLFATLPTYSWPLSLCAIVLAWSYSAYFIAYHTDFSKVKHVQHGGKEVGFALNFEKIGTIIGPVIGGVLATMFSPQVVFYVACGMVVVASIPFLMTKEAIRGRQNITFKGLSFRKYQRDFLTYAAQGIDNTASNFLWPLYLAMVLSSAHIFRTIGLLSAVGVATTFLFIHAIGKLVDNRRVHRLYNYGVLLNSLVHFTRPFINAPAGAALINVANEQATTSYRLPLTKAFYDRADELPGYRIAYITSMEAYARVWQVMFFGSLVIVTRWLPDVTTLRLSFVFAGLVALMLYTQNFPALKR